MQLGGCTGHLDMARGDKTNNQWTSETCLKLAFLLVCCFFFLLRSVISKMFMLSIHHNYFRSLIVQRRFVCKNLPFSQSSHVLETVKYFKGLLQSAMSMIYGFRISLCAVAEFPNDPFCSINNT